MGSGTEDKGTYNRMTRTLPKQPSRCTGVMTFYEQPNFQLFLKEAKKVIRTCVQEGRENELLDNNQSLVSAWNEMQQQPVSMNLQKGRKIQVVPQYDWEPTSGPPFWRTTRITFNVQRKTTPAPPILQYQVPDVKDKPDPPVPRPIDPCSRSITDCKPVPPTPTGFEEWFYCTEAGVKSVRVKTGQRPPAQADATSGFYPTMPAARLECFKHQKNIIDLPPAKKPPAKKPPEEKQPDEKQPKGKQPPGTQPKTTGSSSGGNTLGQLDHLLPLFLLFGSVLFFGEAEFVMESMFEVYELENELNALYPGEQFLFQLEKNRVKNTLSVNVIRNGVPQNLQTFIENLERSGNIGVKDYDRLKDLADTVEVKMQQLDGARSLGFARKQGTRVRGFFIEDTYIEKKLQSQGYVGLPNWFKGYDAYKEGAIFDPPKLKGGKYVTTFYDPDLISIKSYEPQNGLLRNLDLNYLDRQSDEWLENMKGNVFEKDKVRIVLSTDPQNPMPPSKKEIHLVILSEDEASQFREKIQGIAQLATKKRFTIKIIQYIRSTATFKSLL